MTFNIDDRQAKPIFRLCLMLAWAGFLSACAPRISPQPTLEQPQAAESFPGAYYQQAKAAGAYVLSIDTKRSLIVIDVRRSGVLARLGHDHVVASHDVNGYVDITGGRADLYVPLDRLAVDEVELRAAAGLGTQIKNEAIEATRRNMLDKVLESSRFPIAHIYITRAATNPSLLTVAITLHGTMKVYEVPVQINTMQDEINISGLMSFNQSDFGITPFSILGGAMQVQDRVDLNFRIIATRS